MHPNDSLIRINEYMNKLLSEIEPSSKLKSSILQNIKKEEIKISIYKIFFGSIASISSIALAVIAIINISKDFYQSGLYEYLSLLFSDGASLISNWQSYAMSIVESLPILTITVMFASVWIFMISMNAIMKNSRVAFYKFN